MMGRVGRRSSAAWGLQAPPGLSGLERRSPGLRALERLSHGLRALERPRGSGEPPHPGQF